MAIKRRINGKSPIAVKSPILKKTIEGISIKPEIETISDVAEESVEELIIKDNYENATVNISDSISFPTVCDDFQEEVIEVQKNDTDIKLVKLSLCIGVGILFLIILNKK